MLLPAKFAPAAPSVLQAEAEGHAEAYEEPQQLREVPCEEALLMSMGLPGFTTALPGPSASTCVASTARCHIHPCVCLCSVSDS